MPSQGLGGCSIPAPEALLGRLGKPKPQLQRCPIGGNSLAKPGQRGNCRRVIAPAPSGSGLTAPGRALAPFRYPAFRAIWTANLTSNFGSMIQSVAAAWLMTDLTRSHQLVALVQASTTIPILLLAVFAGAIADNHDRRKVMLAAQAGMLIASALLAALTFAGMASPFSLLFFTFAVGAGTALNGPAWQASVRLQVGPGDLAQAISLNTIAFNLARSVGPALGGLLISLTSPALAFAINALSYLALIAVLLRWKPEVAPPQRHPAKGHCLIDRQAAAENRLGRAQLHRNVEAGPSRHPAPARNQRPGQRRGQTVRRCNRKQGQRKGHLGYADYCFTPQAPPRRSDPQRGQDRAEPERAK